MINKFFKINSNIHYILNAILILVIFLTYINSLYYVFADYRDEIGYLSDSVLLAEGMRPSYSHAPSGISTWFGTLIIFVHFLFSILNNLLDIDLKNIFLLYDDILFQHYRDLGVIKISLFCLNVIFMITFWNFAKNDNKFLTLFFLCFFSPFLINFVFSGKPYFLACLFASISLYLKNRSIFFSVIFIALAICERLEFVLLINYVLPLNNIKNYSKNIFYIILIFFAVSPWFMMSFLQNMKVIFGYVHVQPSIATNIIGGNFNLVFFILLLLSFFLFPLFNKRVIKYILVFVFFSSLYFVTYLSNIPIRWFLPIVIVIIFFVSNYQNQLLNKFCNGPIPFIIIFLFLINFNYNLKNKISDKEILELELKEINSVFIGPKLLVEESNFTEYTKSLKRYLYNFNSKNIIYFSSEDAPLSFGNSGNLEILQNRRYEFLSKYNNSTLNQKYIFSDAGLYKSKEFYCNNLNFKNIKYYNFIKQEYLNCE